MNWLDRTGWDWSRKQFRPSFLYINVLYTHHYDGSALHHCWLDNSTHWTGGKGWWLSVRCNLSKRVLNSFIFQRHLILFKVAGGQESISASFGWEVGYTLKRSPVHCRTNTEINNDGHSHLFQTVNFSITNIQVFGWWKEGRVPEMIPNTHTGRNCKVYTEKPQLRFEPGTFYLYVTVYSQLSRSWWS